MSERRGRERSRRSTKSQSRGLPRLAVMLGGATVVVIAVIIALSLRDSPTATETPPASTDDEYSRIGRVLGVEPPAGGAEEVLVGQKAPNFRWRVGSGETRSLAGLRGRSVVLLEFLATWCPHCQRMAPVVAALYDDYREHAVTFLGVNASPFAMDRRSRASPADMADFASRFGAAFPLAFDPAVALGRVYGVRTFPTTLIIDRQGVVYYAHSGEVPQTELAAALTAALGTGGSS